MTAQIKIVYSDGRTEERILPPGTYLAGREQGDIVLRDPNTSGRHAQIDVQFGRVTITDLGSTNGTYDLQGQRLAGPCAMLPNQAIRLGTTTIMLVPPQMTAAGTQVMQQIPGMPGVPSVGGPPPNTAPYAQPQPSYGQPPASPYGQAPGAPYGQPPGASYGQPQQAQAQHGQPQPAGAFGQAPSAPFGQPPGAPYGQLQPGQPAGSYGQPPPGAAYGQPPPGAAYGQPPGAPYGQPPQPAGSFGQPPGAPYAGNPYQPPGAVMPGAIAGFSFSPGGEALWGARAIGFIIDSVIVGAIMTVIVIVFTLISGLVAGAAGTMATAGAPDEAGAALGMFFSQYLAMMLVLPLVALALVGYNRVYLVSKRGYSIGQGVMKLKVVNASGGLLPFGTAALRVLAQFGISLVPLGSFVDLLWPLWDQHRQTLHDKVTGAFVFPDQARQ